MKQHKLFLLLWLFVAVKIHGYIPAVDRRIDSLKYILKVSENTERVDLLNQIARYQIYVDKFQIYPYASEALKLARKLNYKTGTGKALYNLGFGFYINNNLDSANIYARKALSFGEENNLQIIKAGAYNLFGLLEWKKGNLKNAIENFNKSLKIAKEYDYKTIEGKSLNYLGVVNHLMGRYSNAIEYFINSIGVFENDDNKIDASITLNNLAKIYNEIGNYDKAVEFATNALKYAEELHDNYSLGRALNNLGKSYQNLKEYKKALGYLKRAKDLKAEIGDSVGLAYVLEDIAENYLNLKKYNNAEKVLKRALIIREKTDSPYSQVNTLLKLADLKLKTGKLSEAKYFIDKGVKLIPEALSDELLMTAYKLYSQYYEHTGDFKNAFSFYKKSDSLLHEVFNKEENKRIAELELKYDLDKKEKENQLLKGENELKALKLDYQSDVLTLIIGLALMSILLVVVLTLRIKANKKSNEILKQKNLEIEKTNKILEEKNKLIFNHKEELSRMVNVLKREVNERKKYEQELISAKNRAEQANKLKSEFLAGISHEIRTPVNTILSYVSLLKEDLANLGNGDYSEYFDPIQNGSDRLIRTIDSILNMSQFQSGEFELFKEKFDLYGEVLVGLIKEFQPFASKKNLRLNLYKNVDDTMIYGDQYTITQLFTNLVDNAVKYTNEGFINVSIFKKDGNFLYVSVEDSGIGITKEFLPNLFEPFHQEEMGYSRAFDGNGLGLALVKKYVEVNKGKIEVFSEKGKGTKFVVALQLANVEQLKVVNNGQ